MVTKVVNQLFYFYYILIILRIFLTWIPSIDWQQQPFTFMRAITDPYLNIFRGIIPPIGGMFDISPILAFILLSIMQGLVVGTLNGIGL
jgi:YggT family protein